MALAGAQETPTSGSRGGDALAWEVLAPHQMSMGWRRVAVGGWQGAEGRGPALLLGVGWEGGLPGAGAGGEQWEEGNVVWGQEVRVLGV